MVNTSETSLRKAYWKANLRLVFTCLLVWFTVSYGFGILLVQPLNEFRLFGFKLGFWFAQQGSIYIFLLLIFFYAWRMNKLDQQFQVHEESIAPLEQTLSQTKEQAQQQTQGVNKTEGAS